MINCESVFKAIEHTFSDYHIPWSNLVSVLMDSCNVMRGSNTSVELRIKANAPNLIDVDGDIYHTIHNAAKMFAKRFDYYNESLFTDIHLNVQYLTDLKVICELCGMSFTMPEIHLS